MSPEPAGRLLLLHTPSVETGPVLNELRRCGIDVLSEPLPPGGSPISSPAALKSPLQVWLLDSIESTVLEDLETLRGALPQVQVCLIAANVTGDVALQGFRSGACEVFAPDKVKPGLQAFLRRAKQRISQLQRQFNRGKYDAAGAGFQHGVARLLHDMNSPITAIQNSFEMIEMEREVEGAELSPKEKLIAKGIGGAQAITNHWHEYLRAQERLTAVCDLHAAIHTAAEVVLSEHPEIALEAEPEYLSPAFEGTIPERTIQGDPFTYELIFFHLYANAAEALEDAAGGKVRIELNERDSLLTITIEDNGPGIHPHVKNTLWKDFQTTKSERGHFGLGLGVVRYLLMTVGGSIRFADTKKLGGAAFMVELRPRPPRDPAWE